MQMTIMQQLQYYYSKKLGERLEIVGGADKTKLSDNNIGSVVDNTGKINVKLAKELKDLTIS